MEQMALRIFRARGHHVYTVQWKANRRVMASVGKRGVLNLHTIYKRAEKEDLTVLADVLSGRAGERQARMFERFIEDHLPRELEEEESRLSVRPPKGLFHDLDRALDAVKHLLDEPLAPMPRMGWSPARVGRRGITWGTHRNTTEGPLVLVNAVLDAKDTPDYVVEHIVWHELCHQAVPPQSAMNGRRKVHSRAFRELESRYPRLAEAEKWEQSRVAELIRKHRARRNGRRRS